MDTTIDTLAIEIESESGNSTQNMEALISVLERLNASINSSLSNLDKFKKSLTNINNVKINSIKLPKVASTGGTSVTPTGGSNTDVAPDTGGFGDTKVPSGKGFQDLKESADDAEKGVKKLKKTLKDVSSTLSTITGATRGFLKPLQNTIKKVIPDAKTLNSTLRKSFSNALLGSAKKFTLAMLGVRSLFTTLRSAVQEYMNYDTKLEDSLRNNWAVLGSLLAPALERIIQLFGLAVGYIRGFIKALTGIDLVARANTKSMASVGESAKKTLGNLAKFDDLNVVEFPETSGGGGEELPELTTPEVDVSKIEWFVEYIKNNDWYGLGMEIGKLFNEGLRNTDFDWFTQVATQWATNIGDLLNGLTDGTDWALLGEKIAGGLNTAFAFVNTFFATYNFDNLGSSVALGLNTAFSNLDTVGLGTMLSNKIEAIVQFAGEFAENFKWGSFGKKIGESINAWFDNISWGQAGRALSDGIAGVLESISSTLEEVDWEDIGYEIGRFLESIDWGTIWENLKEVIFGAIGGFDDFLTEWFGEGTATTVEALAIALTAVATAIGLISTALGAYITWVILSTALTIAFNISLGSLLLIFAAIVLAIVAVVAIGITLYKNWDTIKEKASEFASKIKEIFQNIKDKISEILGNVAKSFRDAWTGIKEAFKPENIKEFFLNTLKKIKDVFSSVGSWFGEIFSGAWEKVKKAFSKVGSFFSGIWNTIKNMFSTIGTTIGNAIGDAFKNVVNSILTFAENTINGFIKAINKAIGVINKIPNVNIKKLDLLEIPKLATGTNRIESEGLYHLHKNEAVVPAKYNPAVNDDLYNNGNAEVVAELQNLREAVNNMSTTNIINIGNKTLYKETISYARSQNEKYGENVMSF